MKKRCVESLILTVMSVVMLTGCGISKEAAKQAFDAAANASKPVIDDLADKANEALRPETGKRAEEMDGKLAACLDSGDPEEMKQLFAAEIDTDDKEVSEAIDRIFGLYDGDSSVSVFHETGGYSHEENDYGIKKKQIEDACEITCKSGKRFYVRYGYCYRCDTDEDKIGLYQLSFQTSQYAAAYWGSLAEYEKPDPVFVGEYGDDETVRCSNHEYFVSHDNIIMSRSEARDMVGKDRDEVLELYGEPNCRSKSFLYGAGDYSDDFDIFIYYLSDKDENGKPLYAIFWYEDKSGAWDEGYICNEDEAVERFTTGTEEGTESSSEASESD